MDLGLCNKKVIVCVFSCGFGKGCVEVFVQVGCDVVINGWDQVVLEVICQQLMSCYQVMVILVVVDVLMYEG